MALQTYTITGTIARPGSTSSLDSLAGKITLWPTTVDMAIRDSAAHILFAGAQTWDVAPDGTLSITLIATNAAGLQPAGEVRWTGEYVSSDRSVTLRIPPFALTANTTFDALVDLSGVPITSSLLAQVIAARDATLAVGTTNDTIIAGRINTPGSATRTALDALYTGGGGSTTSVVGIDTDGVPYYNAAGVAGSTTTVLADTDGVPYFA